MKIRHLLYFCSLLVLCCENAPEETKATPKLFTLLSSNDTGIDFNNIIKDDKDKNIFAYANFYGGGGGGGGGVNFLFFLGGGG
ncbi:MAG TPA: hypothetical protein DCG42_07905, partial [Maribacter sp.]|nr:hypothetical protein [Maribacter sp.]